MPAKAQNPQQRRTDATIAGERCPLLGDYSGIAAGLPALILGPMPIRRRTSGSDRKNIGPLMEVARVREPFSFGTPERRRFAMQFGYDMRPSFWQEVRSNSHLVIAAVGTAALLGVAAVALWLALPASERQAAASHEQSIPTIPVKTMKIVPAGNHGGRGGGAAGRAQVRPGFTDRGGSESQHTSARWPTILAGPGRSRRPLPRPLMPIKQPPPARLSQRRTNRLPRRHSHNRRPIPTPPTSLPRLPPRHRRQAAIPMARRPPPFRRHSRKCRTKNPRMRKARMTQPKRSRERSRRPAAAVSSGL